MRVSPTLKVFKHFMSGRGLLCLLFVCFSLISPLNAPHYFPALHKLFMICWILACALLFTIFPTLLNSCPPRKIAWCGYRRWCELCPSDAVHAAVQPAGKTAVTEMVCASVWQGKEEDIQRPRPNHTGKEAQDVQLPGMEGPKNCVQEVCKFDSTSNISWKGPFR